MLPHAPTPLVRLVYCTMHTEHLPVIGALLLPDHESGILCRLNCNSVMLVSIQMVI